MCCDLSNINKKIIELNMKKISILTLVMLSALPIEAKEKENYIFVSPYFSLIQGESSEELLNEQNIYGLGLDIGYRYNNNLGARLRIEQLEIDNSLNSSKNYLVGIDGMYHFDQFSNELYTYAGLRHAKTSNSHIGLTAGIGYQYKLDNNWDIRVEGGAISFFDSNKLSPNINLGINYRFDQPQKIYKSKEIEYYVYENKPIRINLDVKFQHDSSIIDSIYHEQIQNVATFLKKNSDSKITIEGHASHLGTDQYNLNLSQRRSEAISAYLIKNFDIDPSRVESIGYGESRPLVKGKSLRANRANRRVVAVLDGIERIKVLKK